ncbi:hypothetical protein [Fodinibius sp. AD559]|uniref:hypothetical protein n=1 Tax=Fodinibius sp. AD559 TaxID=3424179 RepID=UPI004046D403
MNDRLFHALRKQLEYEVFFVSDVGNPYQDVANDLKIVDFNYKGQQCHLILNGNIKLKTQQNEKEIDSFQELIRGLMGVAA